MWLLFWKFPQTHSWLLSGSLNTSPAFPGWLMLRWTPLPVCADGEGDRSGVLEPPCVCHHGGPALGSEGKVWPDWCRPFLEQSVPEAEEAIFLRRFWHSDLIRVSHLSPCLRERCLPRPTVELWVCGIHDPEPSPLPAPLQKGTVGRGEEAGRTSVTQTQAVLPTHSPLRCGHATFFFFLKNYAERWIICGSIKLAKG